MPILTQRRLAIMRPILESYMTRLRKHRTISNGDLEMELRKALDTGYRTIKGLMIELLDSPDYGLLALHYLDETPGPPSEAKPHVERIYGVRRHSSVEEWDDARQRFWETALPLAQAASG